MEIKLGDVLYHKATRKLCIVLQLSENDRVFVRDGDNLIQEYNKFEFEENPVSRNIDLNMK